MPRICSCRNFVPR